MKQSINSFAPKCVANPVRSVHFIVESCRPPPSPTVYCSEGLGRHRSISLIYELRWNCGLENGIADLEKSIHRQGSILLRLLRRAEKATVTSSSASPSMTDSLLRLLVHLLCSLVQSPVSHILGTSSIGRLQDH